MNINENQNDNSTTGDNRGKFSDRLKKISRDKRFKKRKLQLKDKDDSEEKFLKRNGRNVLKIILALPSVVYSVVKNDEDIYRSIQVKNNVDDFAEVKTKKIKQIRDLDVASLKKQKEKIIADQKKRELAVASVLEKNHRIGKLQKEIIDLIKKNLVKNINELELLQSELYLLKELNGEDIYLKNCQEDIKEIKKLLSKIKSLKEKYDYLKDNVSFECILEYNDNLLIDKILEFKDLCSDPDVKYVVDNYKILDEFKFLYLKIDKLQNSVQKYDEYKVQKEQELKERDIDFENLKNNVYDIDRENERYTNFVKEQEIMLNALNDKIANIESYEKISYKLKGFEKIIGNSFKYLGLLLVNPLKGLIPGIATQTVITKNLIHNLYNNLEWEEHRKMVYEAIDYSNEINIAINNLDSTLILVNSTLDDIVALKSKFIQEFVKYQYSIPSYMETMKKINKMENAILGNKIKIELMQEKMKLKEKQNRQKMGKVKKLNSSSNNANFT